MKRSASLISLDQAENGDIEEGRKPSVSPQSGPATKASSGRRAAARSFVLKWGRALLTVLALYVCLLGILAILVRRLPTRGALSEKAHLPQDTHLLMKLPRNVGELREVRHTLQLYRSNYSVQVATLLLLFYLVMQALSIPGTVAINLLVGSMYNFWLALLAIALVSTAGACLNYELSSLLFRDMVIDLMPHRISLFHRSIQKHHDNLLNYFVVLRVTPLLPSWFINLAAPIVNIPFQTFALGTLIGMQPLNFITVSAGRTLGRLQSYSDLYGPKTLVTMLLCAVVAMLPVLLKHFLIRKRTGVTGVT